MTNRTTAPILVVDDEPQNLAAMRQVLAPDHHLIFACGGHDALVAARKHHPALILLDIEMPGMNGYEVCRALKSDFRTAGIPVIFVTTHAEVGSEAAGFDAGAVDYIVKPVSPPVVRARIRTHLSLVQAALLGQSHRDAVCMLGQAGHFRDNDTGAHIWRMAAYAASIARAWGWSAEDCDLMELAAPMHDTGKLAIPDAILLKPGKLDAAEWEIMKTHARIGHEILANSDAPLFRIAAEIALYHHERWDGAGYPQGLAGEAIPECARIVAVADVFDALTMKRPYKDPWPMDRALAYLRESAGRHFDARLVDAFVMVQPEVETIRTRWNDRERDGLKCRSGISDAARIGPMQYRRPPAAADRPGKSGTPESTEIGEFAT